MKSIAKIIDNDMVDMDKCNKLEGYLIEKEIKNYFAVKNNTVDLINYPFWHENIKQLNEKH